MTLPSAWAAMLPPVTIDTPEIRILPATARWYAARECFAVTCPVSWASTAAISASLSSVTRSPRLMTMKPPGTAKAFGTEEFRTRNWYFRLGRCEARAIRIPTPCTYSSSSRSL